MKIYCSYKTCIIGSVVFQNYEEKKIICTTFEGDEVFSISSTPQGNPANPAGVCCDDAGDIYVSVHYGTGRSSEVHHYDPDGVYIGCVARGLYNPLDMTFAPSGDLVVADRHSVKIFQRV